MPDRNIVGRNIKYYRDKINMVQEELAYQADITTSYLSRVENGKQKLSFDIACRIAQALCISTDQLYEEKHDQAHKENSPLGIRMQQIEKQLEQMPVRKQMKALGLVSYIASSRFDDEG
ncbi:helix-turn-helix domain-containing protein [Anaerotruncus rubiinfantis]|uniref:helix-turn-helix domain-containing protein n=1 Tax=Anaerotruncus rubiinfantis TaxID=1720200 RepID=UPI001898FD9C|nr:helix-turn-helix transcriptional regulator [Anaerotruncus rubiinfantis]